MRKIQKVSMFVSVMLFAVALSGCSKVVPPAYKVDLELWGIFDDAQAYRDVISPYEKLNQAHVGRIEYKKKVEENYRRDLLAAFAEGNGPDMFLVRNAWLPLVKNLIESAPDAMVTEKEFRDTFADAAINDCVIDGKVYCMPLAMDSLALYYNKDLLNAAGISTPPATWEEFLKDDRLLSAVDAYGNITESAVSMGTAKNINRSTDVLLALALQQGLKSTRDGFYDNLEFSSAEMSRATDFYAQFAKTSSPYYSWNADQHYSIDTFSEGKLAMMINYSWNLSTIRNKNAKLNFGVSPLPQFSGLAPSNIANYWVLVVAKNRKAPVIAGKTTTFPVERYNDLRVHESWQFLRFLTLPHPEKKITLRNYLDTQYSVNADIPTDPAKAYLQATGQPSARRDLLEEEKNDAWLAPFAYGNLIARTWRVGEVDQAEGALADVIESIYRGEKTTQQALGAAANQISLLLRSGSSL
jgi:multiple sugar transport system substrate-binding protein